jgi:hypothetical protein
MPEVLEFNPNRDLSFDPERNLQFEPKRDLAFDPGRKVGFEPGRDLGFGKRGPVFRGFVCPICGAQVSADQPSCTECGAVFDPKGASPPRGPQRPPARHAPLPPPPPPDDLEPPRRSTPPAPRAARPPPAGAYPMPPKRVESKFCVFCGARVTSEDAFCWQCGNRAGGA